MHASFASVLDSCDEKNHRKKSDEKTPETDTKIENSLTSFWLWDMENAMSNGSIHEIFANAFLGHYLSLKKTKWQPIAADIQSTKIRREKNLDIET